jgi:hypothetical protein
MDSLANCCPLTSWLTWLMQWPNARKILILVVCSLYSFLSNSALLGPSVYIGIYAGEFDISPNVASNLISYANLAYGFGGLPWSFKDERRRGADMSNQGLLFWCQPITSSAAVRSCWPRSSP